MTIYKYAPAKTSLYSKEHGFVTNVPVKAYSIHQPGSHYNSGIKPECYAVEMRTEFGSRFYGFKDAIIDGSLQVACKLMEGQEKDEVLMKWEDAPAF